MVQPYPVDWNTLGWSDGLTIQSDFLQGLNLLNIAVHEWIGLAAYRVTGKTSELFPSPDPDAGPRQSASKSGAVSFENNAKIMLRNK